jgi:hypothetical protein
MEPGQKGKEAVLGVEGAVQGFMEAGKGSKSVACVFCIRD